MATATPNIYEEYETRLETKARIELCDLRYIQEWLAKQESLLAHFEEGKQRNDAQGKEAGLGHYATDSIEQLLEDITDEIERGKKIAAQMSDVLSGRGMSFRAASFPIATHTPAAE